MSFERHLRTLQHLHVLEYSLEGAREDVAKLDRSVKRSHTFSIRGRHYPHVLSAYPLKMYSAAGV